MLPRLFLQAAAVAIVIVALPADLRLVPPLPFWLERALIGLALLWFVNLVNFMDGIDWMTVAEVVPVTAGLVLFGLMGALPNDATVVALALGGAMIGFAPFNRPVARLFLGDVGSLPIGLLLGWLLIELAGAGHLAASLLLPLYYLADATITLLRRLAQRRTGFAGASNSFLSARDRQRLQRDPNYWPRLRTQRRADRSRSHDFADGVMFLSRRRADRRLRPGRRAALSLRSRQGLIERRDHLSRRHFVETRAVAIEPTLAAFELARHTR